MTLRRPCSLLSVPGAAAGLALCALHPSPAAGQTRAEMVRTIDSIAASPVVEGRVAGLSVAVVRGADTLLMKSYGRADLEWDVPMPADAVFEIGSVTKQFTAAAILQLRDEGKLDLDADLTEYLPDFPTHGHRIPVRRLLDHTSGIRGATEIPAFRHLVTQEFPRDTLLAVIAAEPYDFTPGEALIYNNSGYILLGHIIEKVSGMTYEAYVEERLFAPLGMHRSSYCSNTEVVARRAHGYQLRDGKLHRAAYNSHTWPFSAGSLCSTTGDLIAWLRGLHGGRVLPPESYREMITPRPLVDGTPVRYAMGLATTPDPRGRPAIHHGGAISGFVASTRYYPGEELFVAVLVNTTGNLSADALAGEMADAALPAPPTPPARRFEGDAAPLVGTYSGPARGARMTLEVTDTGSGPALSVNGGPSVPIRWMEGWTFDAPGGRIVTFQDTGDGGSADLVRVDGGNAHYVLRRHPG